jgi:ribonuclease VapC
VIPNLAGFIDNTRYGTGQIAVLFAEPGYLDLVDRILEADHVRMGAPTLAETSLVFAGRRGKADARPVEDLVKELGITVVPFGEAEWRVAVDAFVRFGRGRHAAALNSGDCLAYASAAVAGDRLLYVGDDFAGTDIQRA